MKTRTWLQGLRDRFFGRATRASRRRRPTARLGLERLEDRTVPTAVAPPSGLISWWTADDTAADLMAVNNASLFNGATYAAGKVADGFNFDGVDDNLQAPTAGLPIGSADRTIELWARIDQQVAGEAFFASYGAPGSTNQVYALGTLSDGRLFVSTWGPAIFGPALENGRWYHVAATNIGQSFHLYLDGVEVASGDMGVNTLAGSTFWMGRQTMTSLGDFRRLDGMVDEVTVYNRALSASEIQAIYGAGSDGKIKDYIAADFPSVVEGPSGSTSLVTFTIRRVGSVAGQAVVDWATADGTATAGTDYVATSGQVVFQDGESQKTVEVTVTGDDTLEANETFQLVLSTTTPGYAVGEGQATIVTDDVEVSVNDASAIEGDTTTRFVDTFVSTNSGGLLNPRHLAFGPDGKLYVASKDSDEVLRYDAATGAFIDVVIPGTAGLDDPWTLDFGPDGNLYVAGLRSNNVLRYNLGTGLIDEFVSPGSGGLMFPKGLTFGPDGNLYVSSADDGTPTPPDQVLRFNGRTGAFMGVFVTNGSGGLDNPNGLLFGPDGNLYVANTRGDSVNRYDGTTGTFLNTFVAAGSGGLDAPTGMSFRGGKLYVAGQATNAVLVYDAVTGAYLESITGGGLSGPNGIDFDAAGNLYVGSSVTHQVLRYGPASQAVFTVSLSSASGVPVTVGFDTANGSATAGSDYNQTSGTVTFAPGETTKTILVQILPDAVLEPDETFTVNLSNPSAGATITDAQGVGTILDPGQEIHVNTTTAGAQLTTILPVNYNPLETHQAIASDSAGNFVVAWSGNGVGDADGIFFQRYDASATPLGGETRANVTTANAQTNPVVGRASSNGKYVIAWNSNNGVYGRAFNANGRRRATRSPSRRARPTRRTTWTRSPWTRTATSWSSTSSSCRRASAKTATGMPSASTRPVRRRARPFV